MGGALGSGETSAHRPGNATGKVVLPGPRNAGRRMGEAGMAVVEGAQWDRWWWCDPVRRSG
ncbi:hypothetical protein Q0Z83_111110 [Actinoplanes sichuanensis]|nr:hypothetical protein Q0Z83_111110 [Actinoplanes sichuanensis]